MNRHDKWACALIAMAIALGFGAGCKSAVKKQRRTDQAERLGNQLKEVNDGVVRELRSYSTTQKANPGDAVKLNQAQTRLRARLKALVDRYRSIKVPFSGARDHYQVFGTYLEHYVAFIETILIHDLTAVQTPAASPARKKEVLGKLLAAKKKWEGTISTLKANQARFAKKYNLTLTDTGMGMGMGR